MNAPLMSFEQGPPVSVPYRFFVAAPLFGIIAGLTIAAGGADIFSSRWTPGALAAVHALGLGFVLQAVCGALLQVVPVVAGNSVRRPRLVAVVVQSTLVAGTLALIAGFACARPAWFGLAAPLLGVGIATLLAAVASPLWHAPPQGMSIVAIRLSLMALAVTALLGIALAGALSCGWPLPMLLVVDVHAAWALGGWALMLIAGVSYLVVPMFMMTPPYPEALTRATPWGLGALCMLWSLQLIDTGSDGARWPTVVAAAAAVLLGLHAATTLRLLNHRRRRIADAGLNFWRGGMGSLLASALSWAAMQCLPALAARPEAPIWLGILILVGVLMSVINGMLYKIVPFLGSLHLQRMGVRLLPASARPAISAPAMRGQMVAHFTALALLLVAVWLPSLARPGGLALGASCAWLAWNLAGAMAGQRRAASRIHAADACPESRSCAPTPG